MVKKLFTFLNKEWSGVNEAALLIGSFAFLSQILGLFRDRLLAHTVGVGQTLDIYYAAFRIPDFLYVSIASLASITVLMPFLVDRMKHNINDAKSFLNNIFSAFMLCMVVVSIILYIFMPEIARLVAPGFTPYAFEMLVSTSRVMLISPVLIGISNLLGTVTQLYKNFFVFSLAPVFYNIGIILGILFFYPSFGVTGLSYGVVLGAFLHLAIQIPSVIHHNLLPKFVSKIRWQEILSVVKISIPRTMALSFHSLVFIVFISIASSLHPGSISLFTFSFNLQSVPLGILGMSYSVAAFPLLVQSFAKKDMQAFRSNIISGINQIVFWSLPITALFIVLRAQIVRVVLGVSKFSWAETRLTAAAVALFVLSLASQSIMLLLVRGYYASGNTRKPLLINFISSASIVCIGYLLLKLFYIFPEARYAIESILRVRGLGGTEMLALPLAYTLGSMLNILLLWINFRKDFLKDYKTGISRTLYESLTATVIMGTVAYFFLGIFDNVFDLSTFWGVLLQGFCAGVFGIAFGIFVLHIIKNKEYLEIREAMSHKFWKRQVSIPEQHEL